MTEWGLVRFVPVLRAYTEAKFGQNSLIRLFVIIILCGPKMLGYVKNLEKSQYMAKIGLITKFD